MINIKLIKKLIISLIIIILAVFIINKNYSRAAKTFTTSQFLEAVKNVYEMAHNNGYTYGSSGALPPCSDGIISCDRLIARALWDLGMTDQPQGGMTTKMEEEYLTSHGFVKITDKNDVLPGDIVWLDNGDINAPPSADMHTFVVVTYNKLNGMGTKYDMGSQGRIESQQPFVTSIFGEYENSRNVRGIFRWSGGITGNSTDVIQYLGNKIDIEEGKPEKYDIYIDGEDLDPEDGLEIPAIQTSIDYIIYNNDESSNIDFFNTNAFSNKASLKNINSSLKKTLKDNWNDLSTKVKGTFKVILYIALGFMGTILIIIGFLIVKGTIFKDTITDIMKKNMGVTDDNLPNEYYHKKATNQWIFTLLTLILIIIFIIVSISFTGVISKLTSTYNEKDQLLDSVKVYAKAEVNSNSSSSVNGLGTKKDIDENTVDKDGNNLVSRMSPSLHGKNINNLIDSDGSKLKLSYLEIPYYSTNNGVKTGEMIVHQKLADEVLLIFQELYNIKYPIETMELVDNYGANDWKSIQANNTSAFNYRNANDGQRDLDNLSNHAYGKCIDINPLVNPYIINYHNRAARPYTTHKPEDGPNGTDSSNNFDDKFIKRDTMEGWTDVEKRERIAKDTEIYNIFTKYGWTWLETAGSHSFDLDSQHFQKLDVSNVKTIDWNSINNKSAVSSNKTSGGSEKDIILIGDSRTQAFTEQGIKSDITFICESGVGYNWMINDGFKQADAKVTSNSKVIIWLGVNDLDNIDNYIREVNNKAQEWVGKGATVYYAAVGPLDHDPNATNEGIERFNTKLKSGLSSNVQFIDLYTKLKNEGYSTGDGIHYTTETTQKIHDFLVNEVTSGTSSSGNSSSSRNPSGPSPFTKYQLTDHQLTGLAAVAYSEQGSLEGAAAEASLMANLFELHHNGSCNGVTGGTGLYNMVGAPRGSRYFWFDQASTFIDSGHLAGYAGGGPVTDEMKAVVKSVLVDGKRTLPGYVDEHASTSLVQYISNNGVSYDDTDRSKYIPHVTIVHQPYSSYIYYCHVADSTDPFGYTSEEARARIGDFHYNFDGTAVGNVGSTMDISFTTNFEGLYMILSNYNWDNYLGHNIVYLICGIVLSIFKIVLYYILYFRMLIIGGIIAIIPAIIVINSFIKIRGNEGIFKKWAILYLECLFYRPLIQIIYRIFANNKNKSVEENPFYIMFVVIVIIIITIIYIKKIYRDFRKKEITKE